jgi:threonine synthase
VEKQFGVSNLLIKDESKNPFGTFKDRRNAMAIEKAMEERVDKLVLITSGSAGHSLARLAEGTGIKVVCVVDMATNSNIKKNLEKYSYRVVEADLSQNILKTEDIIELARETNDEVILDVTNGYHAAFQSIVTEVKDQAPGYLVTPLGSGEAFVGLYQGLKRHRLKTILVGAGVHHISDHELELRALPSVADKLYTPYTPYRKMIMSILEEGNQYVHLSEKEIIEAYEKLGPAISCEPSSATAFASLPKLDCSKDSKVLVVNSGKTVWAK